MNSWQGPSLEIGDLTAKLPIVQGGMGIGVSLSGLASAVANEGGIGVISAACIGHTEPDFQTNFIEANIRSLKNEIKKAREMTKGILGVNIMAVLSNYAESVKTAIDEGIDVIFSGAGLPLNLPSFLKGSKTKLVPIVSSARALSLISKKWIAKYDYAPDAVVVEGPKAGGHLGFKVDQLEDPNYSLEKIVDDVLVEVKLIEKLTNKKIPVIAGGGIYSGEEIHAMLQRGASGVQLATRFVPTIECDASEGFKLAYINSKKEDLMIIKSPVGMPGRAITNKFLEDVEAGKKVPFNCPFHCITSCEYKTSPYCITLALISAKNGKLNSGFAFAGENAYKTTEILSVHEVCQQIINEYNEAIK